MNYEVIFGICTLLLAIGLAWATFDSKRRNRDNDKITEEAVRQEYDHPRRYNDKIRPELEQTIKH